MKFVNQLCAKVMNQVQGLKEDERGSQTLEWIGIAAVIVIIVGVISTQFSKADGFGLVDKFEGLIDKIGGE